MNVLIHGTQNRALPGGGECPVVTSKGQVQIMLGTAKKLIRSGVYHCQCPVVPSFLGYASSLIVNRGNKQTELFARRRRQSRKTWHYLPLHTEDTR